MRLSLFLAVIVLVFVSAGSVFDRKSGISSNEHLWDSVQVGNSRYNLVQIIPRGDPHSPCYLYKCNIDDLACQEISSYIGDCKYSKSFDLVTNPITNEVNVLLDHEWSDGLVLDYTYGDQPRTYLYILKSKDFDYYLAYFHDFDTYNTPFKFFLYKCEKDSINCSRLPFQYDETYLPSGYLEFTDNENELKVFINKELIYIYGNHPKCYVEGCSLAD